jgi:hypothetical protein
MGPRWSELVELARGDVDRLLPRLQDQGSRRRLRLFACGCCRQTWSLLTPEAREVVARIEHFAEAGTAPRQSRGARVLSPPLQSLAAMWAAETVQALTEAVDAGAIHVLAQHAARALRDAAGHADWKTVRRRQVDLLGDLYGNVLEPVAVNSTWLRWQAGVIVKMAEAIYSEHRFAEMPILGDALEEAGCSDSRILEHCRRHPEHARGCWLLDAILGKE